MSEGWPKDKRNQNSIVDIKNYLEAPNIHNIITWLQNPQIQTHIQNPVEHLRRTFQGKQLSAKRLEMHLLYLAQQLYIYVGTNSPSKVCGNFCKTYLSEKTN